MTSDIIAHAYAYVDRGWSVIPLREGTILPAENAWQANPARTRAEVDARFALVPGAGLGIVCGRISGVWVLDVDPDNGGDRALHGLIAAYGRLPETYTVQTPSGGTHYYFLLPADFEPHNMQHGRRAGRLPVGLDVRGWHGYVAAPPTNRQPMGTKAGGRYAIMTDFPVSPAPDWLVDMIRPQQPSAAAAPFAGSEQASWSNAPSIAPAAVEPERVSGYLATALPAVLAELAFAPQGQRNARAFTVACRLHEFINAGWIDAEQAWQAFWRAADHCHLTTDVPAYQAERAWNSARQRIAGKAAIMPDLSWFGTVVDMPAPPPQNGPIPNQRDSEPPANRPDSGGEFGAGRNPPDFQHGVIAGSSSDGDGAGTAELTFIDPISEQPTQLAVPAADPREAAIVAEMARQWVRDEAARRLKKLRSPEQAISILNREQQTQLQLPEPLVNGWLARGQAARIFGPPGAGKSFVAVELAACVSTGMKWHSALTRQAEVAYVAAEDPSGVALRLRAWERHHERQHNVHLIDVPIQFDADGADRLCAALLAYFAGRPVGLLVVDTQAMVTVGMDENAAADMGLFVAAVKQVVKALGASVLIVHHSGIKGGRARGSTSILGAMDVEMEAAIVGRTVTVSSTKQKNTARPTPLMAGLHVVDMDEVDIFGNRVTSAVLVAAGDPGTTGEGLTFIDPLEGLTQAQRRMLAIATVLIETNDSGETYSRIRTRAVQSGVFGKTPSSQTSQFSKAWNDLVAAGRIAKAVGREAFYFIEIDGLDRLAPNPDKRVIGGPEAYVPPDDY